MSIGDGLAVLGVLILCAVLVHKKSEETQQVLDNLKEPTWRSTTTTEPPYPAKFIDPDEGKVSEFDEMFPLQ